MKKAKLTITTLGPEGTYASQAVRRFFPDAKVVFCPTITDVIGSKGVGTSGIRVVPLENSTEGTVRESFDGILEKKLFASALLRLEIKHSLGSKAKNLKDIKVVISHPQAVSQCQKFINKNLKSAKIILVGSTSDSVISALENPSYAAIASSYACDLYGLPVLKDGIEDENGNSTLFGVVAKRDLFSGSKKDEMHIAVTPRRNKPGVLFGILKPFHDLKIDLTRLESRPTRKELGEYRFFISFKIKNGAFAKDLVLQKALKILKKNYKVDILGETFLLT